MCAWCACLERRARTSRLGCSTEAFLGTDGDHASRQAKGDDVDHAQRNLGKEDSEAPADDAIVIGVSASPSLPRHARRTGAPDSSKLRLKFGIRPAQQEI
jgi:hypothetical protein